MTPAPMKSGEQIVLVVGPEPEQVGGMASVVSQMLSLDFPGRYQLELCPNTYASNAGEPLPRRIIRHVRQVGRLREAIRHSRSHVVHLHTCSGFSFYRSTVDMLAARSYRCRVVLHIHGAAFDTFYEAEPEWRRRIIAWSLAHADRVVALSHGWGEKLHRLSPRSRIAIVENAVAIPPTIPRRTDGTHCRFLLLARMDTWKGIDDVLQACTILKQQGIVAELLLAGPEGTAGNAQILRRKIRERHLEPHVRYVGTVTGEGKWQCLQSADAYVQPSHHEGMPLSMLEAFSYGLPVVATNVGAVPEIIADQVHGLLVPPHCPDQLARAMGEMARNPVRRRAMSRAARKLVKERFGLTRFRDDLVSLYDAISASSHHDSSPAYCRRLATEPGPL